MEGAIFQWNLPREKKSRILGPEKYFNYYKKNLSNDIYVRKKMHEILQ